MSSTDSSTKQFVTTGTKILRTVLLLIFTIGLLTEIAWTTGSVNSFYSDSTESYHQSETPRFLLRTNLRSSEPAKSILEITSEVTFGFTKYDGSLGNGDIFTQTIEADGTADMMSFSQWRIDEFEAPDFGVNMQDGAPPSTVTDPNGDSFQFVSFTTEVFCGTPMSFDVVGYEDGSPVSGATKSYTLTSNSAPVVRSVGFASVDEVRFENYSPANGNQCLTIDDLIFDQVVSSNTQPSFANLNTTVTFDEAAGSPVVIDGDATISDTELDGINDYAGSSLTVERTGSANSNDDFSFDTGAGTFSVSGSDLTANGNTFASFTKSNGTLIINFNSSQTAATSALVDDVLQAITYANTGDPTVVKYNLTLTLNDGDAGGALQTTTSLPVVFDPELAPITTNTPLEFTSLGPVLSDGDPIDARIIQELLFYGFQFGDANENSLINSNELHLEQVTPDPNTTGNSFESDGTFSLVSIDIDNFSTTAQDVTVYGYLNGSLKSSQTFSFSAESGYQTKALGFTGIDEVRFTTNDNNSVAIDNIVVDKDTENTALQNSASLTFNGTDNYVDLAGLADDMAGQSSMTVEFWVKPDIANQSDPDGVALFGLNTASGDNQVLIFIGNSSIQDNKVHVYDGPGDSDFDLTGPELTDGKWHHIAYSFDDGTGTLYVNGRQVGQHSIPLTLSSDDQWSMGQEYDSDTASDFFKGQIDEARIWNTARTNQQIQNNLFQPLEGDETSLAGFWPFNNSVYDYSPNSNNAVLVNNPTFSSNTHPLGTLLAGSEGWRMMSSPADGASYGTLLDTLWTQGFTGADVSHGNANVQIWDEAAGNWTALLDASTVPTAGSGFITYIYNDQDYDDTPEGFPKMLKINSAKVEGTVTPSLTYNDVGVPEGNGWNLVGNPYGTTINWDATGWTKTNLNASFYIWNSAASGGAGAYQSWNGSSGTLPDDGKIAPWQGFWVQANAASPTLQFTDEVRSAGGTFLKESDKESVPEISFKLKNSKLSSQAVLMFDKRAKAGKDVLDAWKLQSLNTQNYLSLYTTSSESYALDINALPSDLEQSLKLNLDFRGSNLDGEYTLHWNPKALPQKMSITLRDTYNDRIILLNKTGSYSFEVNSANQKSAHQSPSEGISAKAKGETTFNIPNHGPIPTVLQAKAKNPRFAIVINPNGSGQSLNKVPESAKLKQNYPNPFNPETVIHYGVPEQAQVQLDVYDVLGRKVRTLINEQKSPGNYEARFNGRSLSSGLYFYRLKIGAKVITKKMTLIK